MRFVMFYHSLQSDWNHGNAHFLRGIVTELLLRGHDVQVFEPEGGWSLRNLLSEHGHGPLKKFHAAYPTLQSVRYDPERLDLDDVLDGADVVIVHEWNDPALIRRIGAHRRGDGGYCLLFHDTHHRMVTSPESMQALDLSPFDGVLAYGEALRQVYLASGCARSVWTWHEAADVRVFRPVPAEPEGDLVWIGNWGDEERSDELKEFLVAPSRALSLKTRVHGVRYPAQAKQVLADAGIEHAGWVPNFEVPRLFGRFRVTLHIPRRPYVKALPGIPTIRVFEALACGIPLLCSPWTDAEGLFRPGRDFLIARNRREMIRHLRDVLHDPDLARELALRGFETIHARHTCARRVDELLAICKTLSRSQELSSIPCTI